MDISDTANGPGLLQQGLVHATAQGWTIGNLHHINPDGSCGCGHSSCGAAGKHPKPYGGRNPEAGFLVRTGAASGVFVVDVDIKNGKDGSAFIQKLSPTYTVATPTGGYHFYYKQPAGLRVFNSVEKLHPGVDIRGDGGFVVGAGSPHKNKNFYGVVVDMPVAEAPQWLLDLVSSDASATPVDTSIPDAAFYDVASEEGQRRLAKLVERCRTNPPSIQGNNGSRELWSVAEYGVRGLCLKPHVVAEVIEQVFNPRCMPPWSRKEIDHKCDSAAERGHTPIDRVAPADFLIVPSVPGEEPEPLQQEADYKHTPGDPVPNERSKKSYSELINYFGSGDWEGVWCFDEFLDEIVARHPPLALTSERGGYTSDDVTAIITWLEAHNINASPGQVESCIRAAAMKNKVNCVRDYLTSLTPVPPPSDGSPGFLDTLATEVLGAESPAENLFLKVTLISAARRILQPGCKADLTLVLFGDQGLGKSMFVQTLFSPKWTRTQMPDLANKDSSEALRGTWAVELAELEAVLRSDSNTVKEFLTRDTDKYRPAYERNSTSRPRMCIFIGTTNDEDFLRDPSGNRRFGPVHVTKQVDIQALAAMRDTVWAHVMGAVHAGVSHFIPYELELSEEIQEIKKQYVQRDPWEHDITEFLRGKDWVSSRDVYLYGICKGSPDAMKTVTTREWRRLASVLKFLGAVPDKKYSKGEGMRGWAIPERLSSAPPSVAEATRAAQEAAKRN